MAAPVRKLPLRASGTDVVGDTPVDSMWEAVPPVGYLAVYAGTLWTRADTGWVTADAGTPAGPAGGGLAGTYPNPTVAPKTINTQTNDYTLVLADATAVVEMNKASANALTVPTNASVAFPIGTQIRVVQLGAGVTTITAAGGVTINALGGTLALGGQYDQVLLTKRATNTWDVSPVAPSGPIAGPAALLRRAANTTLEDATTNPILWDTMVDPLTYAPLLAIPAGLGLSFVWDGTSETITATVDGVWAYSLSGYPNADATAGIYGGLSTDVVDWYLPDCKAALWNGFLSFNLSSIVKLTNGSSFSAFVRPFKTPTASPYVLPGMVNLLLTRLG